MKAQFLIIRSNNYILMQNYHILNVCIYLVIRHYANGKLRVHREITTSNTKQHVTALLHAVPQTREEHAKNITLT
jgi:hypothetical protein